MLIHVANRESRILFSQYFIIRICLFFSFILFLLFFLPSHSNVRHSIAFVYCSFINSWNSRLFGFKQCEFCGVWSVFFFSTRPQFIPRIMQRFSTKIQPIYVYILRKYKMYQKVIFRFCS